MKKRGFTVVELLVVLALVTLLLGLGVLTFRNSKEKATSRGVAQLVAEELKLARQEAQAKGVPVAVALPSGGGTTAHARSLYVLEGDVRPRVTRVVDFSKEFEGTELFVGQYALDTTALTNPAATNSTTPLPVSGTFNLIDWDPPVPTDHLFVYTPAGTLFTNGLTNFDGAYHIVVARGVTYAGSPADLTQVGEPETITLTPGGGVARTSGLLAANTSVTITNPYGSGPVAAAPPVSGPSTQAPVYVSVDYEPKVDPSVLTTGADTAVDADGVLTLTVKATEPEGDRLYCRWTATEGGFSTGGWIPMKWDRAEAVWVATRQWRPEPGTTPGSVTTLACEVKDENGVLAANVGAATFQVESTDRGKIVFHADLSGNFDIFVMNGDGSGSTQLTDDPGDDMFPDLSRDGSMITFVSNRTGDWRVYVMNADGTDVRDLPRPWTGQAFHPTFSPDGTKIAYVFNEFSTDHYHIELSETDGSDTQWLTDLDRASHPAWTPDGERIVLAYNDTDKADPIVSIGSYEVATSNFTPIITGTPGDPVGQPSVSPSGELIYQRNGNVWLTTIGGGPGTMIYAGNSTNPRWNADGSRIVLTESGQIHSIDSTGADLEQLTDFPSDGASWSF